MLHSDKHYWHHRAIKNRKGMTRRVLSTTASVWLCAASKKKKGPHYMSGPKTYSRTFSGYRNGYRGNRL